MTPIDQSTRVPAGTRVYAVGDIHGRADLLVRLQRMIVDDAADAGEMRRVVVYMGDYVDRGPDSFEVVEMLLNAPLAGFERHHLKGNHEDFLLRFLDPGNEDDTGEMWVLNGADSTFESYGVRAWEFPRGADGMRAVRAAFREALPESHLAFFRNLEMSHREGDYLFVHAGLRPGVPFADQSAHDLMWIRDGFFLSDADFGAVVVHGHSIRPEPEVRPNRIGIDTGAWRSNRLTALVLEAGGRRFLHT